MRTPTLSSTRQAWASASACSRISTTWVPGIPGPAAPRKIVAKLGSKLPDPWKTGDEAPVRKALSAAGQRCGKIVVLSVARLLGQAIKSIHEETSVSSLFV